MPLRHLGAFALMLGLLAAGCRVMPGGPPTPTEPSAGPPSTPTVAATPTPTVDAAEAFFAAFAIGPPAYHVLMDVAISGVSSGSARIEGDVAGEDYSADVHVDLASLPARDSRIVVVDGTAYLADAEGDEWVTVSDYRSTPPLNPFLRLEPSDFTDLGADPEHGGLRHLRSTTWVEDDASLGLAEGGVGDVGFDVWLDESGTPVEGQLDFRLAGTDPDGQQVDLRYSTVYTFSDVGAEVVIEPPTS